MEKLKKFLFLVVFLASCSFYGNQERCPTLSLDMAEEDFIGEWISYGLDGETDRLILRDDGYYKQTLNLKDPELNYESEWLKWNLENSGNGIYYLHMIGMNACVYSKAMDCQRVEDGFLENEGAAWDYCAEIGRTIGRELILIARGVLGSTDPNEVKLTSLQVFTETGISGYERSK